MLNRLCELSSSFVVCPFILYYVQLTAIPFLPYHSPHISVLISRISLSVLTYLLTTSLLKLSLYYLLCLMITRSISKNMEEKANLLFLKLKHSVQSIKLMKETTTKFGNNIPHSYSKLLLDSKTVFQNTADEVEKLLSEPAIKLDAKELFDLQLEYDSIYFNLLALIAQPDQVDVKPTVIQANTASNLNLPRLVIKAFNGKFLHWLNFKSLYEATIHNSELYSDSQKFQILRSHLEGDALALINTLPITDKNYTIAYNLLCSRYDNIRSSANFHYARLFNLKITQPSQEAFKQFLSTYHASVNALKSFKFDLQDYLLVQLALHSLPSATRQRFEEQCNTEPVPSLEELLNYVTRLEKSYENAQFDKSDQSLLTFSNKDTTENTRTHFTRKSNALILENRAFQESKLTSNPRSHNNYCVICRSENHNAYYCTDFLLLNVDARYKQLSDLNLCHKCLGLHRSADCKSTKKCKVCNSAAHNTILHRHDQAFSNVALVASAPVERAHNVSIQPSVTVSASNQRESLLSSSIRGYSGHPSNITQPGRRLITPSHSPAINTLPPVYYQNIGAPPGFATTCIAPTISVMSAQPSQPHPFITSAPSPFNNSPVQAVTSSPTLCSANTSTRPVSFNNLSCRTGNQPVLLGTAIVHALDSHKNYVKLRAVLDSGSEASLITTRAVQILGIKITRADHQIIGITSASASTQGQVDLSLRSSKSPDFQATCNALVVSSIVGNLPSVCLPIDIAEKFNQQDLADPNFIHSSRVDLLLGADIFSEIIDTSHQHFIKGSPCALQTVFGLVIFGKINNSHASVNIATSLLTTLEPLQNALQKFWEIEEVKMPKITRPEDDLCETIFKNTTTRDETGRYVVALPFKQDNVKLEDNSTAVKRIHSRFERRLALNPPLLTQYHIFMQEYINLGHMSLAQESSSYLIPHHCVVKDSSSTTKVRTVFNGSYQDSSGNSLNAQLLSGPKLQRDICHILISFRMHEIVICADIKQMYRQILVRQQDRHFQHIIYRAQHEHTPHEYQLNTVTYGLTPSAFLAQRTLLQLVQDEGRGFPEAAFALTNHTYVDDILTGASDLNSAQSLIYQLNLLLAKAGVSLRKWSSNNQSLLEQFPDDHLENPLSFSDESPSIKILGLQWVPKQDIFSYHITPFSAEPTKRNILSYVAKMFDPLGFLAPLIFWAKVFLQHLWIEKIDWDDPIPSHLLESWHIFATQLEDVPKICIPRLLSHNHAVDIHLIGFADASERGYAAVLYLRFQHNDVVLTQLIKSKTRVSPVNTITIPRLELCAALLLANLVESVSDSLAAMSNIKTHLFTDAQLVITWLNTPPHKLKIFVSNRIQQILAITPAHLWSHVPTHMNPADIASRGALPQELLKSSLWWNGPSFLKLDPNAWPQSSTANIENVPELRIMKPILVASKIQSNYFIEVIGRYSSYLRLIRTIAYIHRFINNARFKCQRISDSTLSSNEIETAKSCCVKIVQAHHFASDLELIRKGQPPSHALRSLTPFIDPHSGLLKAGGRLKNSSLPISSRHPVLLPKRSHFTKLVCTYFHEKSLHAGPRVTQSIINQEFWISGLRSFLRWLIHNCPPCIRYTAKLTAPLMADLPAHRVNILRPFQAVGLDFAGPFAIKSSSIRTAPQLKAYLCVFVCMSTKAAHLESVSDLSADAFLAAFDRFTSRRGLPSDVYSDNGTNFVGASGLIQDLLAMLSASSSRIADHLSSRHIQWHFNPPFAPNFGGLWEAAIKSTKFHLHRIMHNRILTYEEFSTLLSRIEAVLNSRPLFEPSPDPNELSLTLTPGHFLIGTSLLQPPEQTVNARISLKSRWNLLRHMFQSFWKIWSQHYLHSIIQRHKWSKNIAPLQVGQIVIVYGMNTSPSDWPLARIIEVLPGKDGVVRVVKLKTTSGTYVRPANRLIPITNLDEDNQI